VNLSPEMAAWLTSSFAKVVLQVDTEDELLRLRDLCAAAGIPHALITDAGRTEFHGVPTHTVLAIGPARRSQTDPLCGPDGAVTCRLA
jgi:PTH2 family peptidyl-tRNA hydrolase